MLLLSNEARMEVWDTFEAVLGLANGKAGGAHESGG